MKETFSPSVRALRGVPGAPVVPVTPPDPGALAAKVRTLAPSMTRSMQRVAEAVAGDPAGCSHLTVTALAVRTGTSEATVVRTARLLGYPGYRDLRLALAALAAHQATGAAPAVTADIAVDDPLADVVTKLALEEQQTLADTASQLDMVQLEAAVSALAAARRIDVYGIAASGLVAQDLAQKLLRIGLIAHAHADPHLAVTNAVQLRPGDVALGHHPLRLHARRDRAAAGGLRPRRHHHRHHRPRRTGPSRSTRTWCSPPPAPARASCGPPRCPAGPANSSSWTACS